MNRDTTNKRKRKCYEAECEEDVWGAHVDLEDDKLIGFLDLPACG